MGYLYVSDAQLGMNFVENILVESVKEQEGDGEEFFGFHLLSKRESCELEKCDFFGRTAEELEEVRKRDRDWYANEWGDNDDDDDYDPDEEEIELGICEDDDVKIVEKVHRRYFRRNYCHHRVVGMGSLSSYDRQKEYPDRKSQGRRVFGGNDTRRRRRGDGKMIGNSHRQLFDYSYMHVDGYIPIEVVFADGRRLRIH